MHPKSQSSLDHKIEEKFKDSLQKFITVLLPLTLFLSGALAGCAGMTKLGFWCMCVPIGCILMVIIDIFIGFCVEGDPPAPESEVLPRRSSIEFISTKNFMAEITTISPMSHDNTATTFVDIV
jgi:hypothetical protein